MKQSKFIVFAYSKKRSGDSIDNFIESILSYESYYAENKEYAICLNSSVSEKTQAFDAKYDIFLFDDPKQDNDSLFFVKFSSDFYKNKDIFDFKIILHRGSGWDFENYFMSSDEINPDYANFEESINWLKSLPTIKESNIPGSVYDEELKNIASEIGKFGYSTALKKLDEKFIDITEETMTDDIFNAIYNEKADDEIETFIKTRDNYLLSKK